MLRLAEVDSPRITGHREILVRIQAAGINPIDGKMRRGGTLHPGRLPAVLGCDGAGTVEAAGREVERFRVEDDVYFCSGGIGGDPGNYAEFAVVDERFASPKPRSLTFLEAGAAPLVLITAWEALYDLGELREGQQVLVHGGAGGVGHVAMQLARQRGARVCTTVGSEEKARLVQQWGAEEAILYRERDFVKAALDWTGGRGVDLALDTVGGQTFFRTFAAVRLYGKLVTLLLPDPEAGDWKEARVRNLRVGFEWMVAPMLQGRAEERARQALILDTCGRWFDAGLIKIHVSQSFALGEAVRAHRVLEEGSVTGKMVLSVGL